MVYNLCAVYTRQATFISNTPYRSSGFERLQLRKRTGYIAVDRIFCPSFHVILS